MKIVGALVLATFVVGALCEEKCVPGTTFMEDCNRCRCSADGQRACTRKMCPPNELSDDAQVVRSDVQNGDSLSSADEKDEVHLQTNGQVCTPNEIKMQECNRCRCANNGIGWFCTRRACPPREKRATAPAPNSNCTPGTTFKSEDGCNSCFCSESGVAACTLRACIKNPEAQPYRRRRAALEEPKCTPGTTFKSDDGCNNCFCTNDGHAACTLMACLPYLHGKPQYKRDTSGDMPRSAIAPGTPGFSCTPRASFKYECNTCLCTDDGKSAGCTFKYCIPGEW